MSGFCCCSEAIIQPRPMQQDFAVFKVELNLAGKAVRRL